MIEPACCCSRCCGDWSYDHNYSPFASLRLNAAVDLVGLARFPSPPASFYCTHLLCCLRTQVFALNFKEVELPFLVSLILLVVALLRVGTFVGRTCEHELTGTW